MLLTLLGPQSRFGDKLLELRVVCPQTRDCCSKRVKVTVIYRLWTGGAAILRPLGYLVWSAVPNRRLFPAGYSSKFAAPVSVMVSDAFCVQESFERFTVLLDRKGI